MCLCSGAVPGALEAPSDQFELQLGFDRHRGGRGIYCKFTHTPKNATFVDTKKICSHKCAGLKSHKWEHVVSTHADINTATVLKDRMLDSFAELQMTFLTMMMFFQHLKFIPTV